MFRLILKIVVVSLVYLTLVHCAVNPVTGQRELMLVSESQEIGMGKEFYPNALWGDLGGGGEFRDDNLKAYLRDLVLRIHGISHRANLPVDFAIQNSSVPNAWAIPGHVVVTRGLLAELDNEAEFVFIMGHEMGHVAARHSARHMTYGMLQQIGLGAAGIALSGQEYADLALSAGAIGSSLLLLKYSRSDELEADRLGLLYMSKLGYNPNNAISAHRNLEKAAQGYMKAAGKDPHEKGFFEDLLSTHPRTSVRIDEIQQMIKSTQSSPIAGDGTYRDRFRNMTGGLREANRIYLESYDAAARAMQKNYLEEADSLISAGIRRDQRQPAFHTLKGFILLRKKNYPAAERNFDLAMKMDSNYEPAYRGMGTLFYLRENYSGGIDYLKKSLSLFPQDVLSHYFLGMSYYRTKQYNSAVPHLNLVAEAQPEHPEIHGTLGICYEQTGDLSSAYNEYVLQVKVASDNEMGRHAASRAGALKPILEKKAR